MSFDREVIESKYEAEGLETRYIEDKPGKEYAPHSHGEVRLFTLSGSARVRLDDQTWTAVKLGDEVVIAEGQKHEAKVGDDGWAYIFAASPDEMKRQGL
jgi:quercetin dioxygenase-like cupin family protein